MKITVDINSCKECPYLKFSETYGTDGRDGIHCPFCSLGCFGEFESEPYQNYLKQNNEDIDKVNSNCKFLNENI